MSNPIRQEIAFTANPKRLYAALLDAKQFSAFTGGAPAEISRDPGGTFAMFGGRIVGRNIELVPDQRIVQAWRAAAWPEGVYSIVRFELKADGPGATLTLEHVGYPEGNEDHLAAGWHKMYWEPLKKYLL